MFDPNNWFWRNVSRVGDLLGLSLCWMFCSLPLFTAGAATAALYDAAAHCVRRQERGTFVRYFRSLRDNFLPSLPATLAFLAVEGLLLWARSVTYWMAAAGDGIAGVLFYADYIFLCIPLAVWLMAVTTLSRFTFRGKDLMAAALKLTIRHLPTAALVTVIALAAGFVTWLLIPMVAILPGVAALIISLPLERLFKRYQEKETEQPEQK